MIKNPIRCGVNGSGSTATLKGKSDVAGSLLSSGVLTFGASDSNMSAQGKLVLIATAMTDGDKVYSVLARKRPDGTWEGEDYTSTGMGDFQKNIQKKSTNSYGWSCNSSDNMESYDTDVLFGYTP